jgi:cytochrome oxidase Cu insertion factor (SCO1/SenC/PrrC family)
LCALPFQAFQDLHYHIPYGTYLCAGSRHEPMRIIAGFLIVLLMVSCQSPNTRLPILGEPTIDGSDTVYPTIANFSFTDQDSNPVTNQTFAHSVYVADFIFLSCPTICPVMTEQLQQVYRHYATNERVAFLSHTIDPKHYDPHPPYDAGSIKKALPVVADMMKEMYDMTMLPLIKKYKKQ